MTTPRTVTWLAIRRQLRSWGEKVLMVSMLVAAMVGLSWISRSACGPSRAVDPDDKPGLGVVLRTDVLRLWLPGTLIEFAEHRPQSLAPQTHSQLRALLERRGQTDLWYAL